MPAPVAVGLLVVGLASLWDIFRISFYADDLYFLDAARRMPPHEVLLGHYGIYPWYRPLSRELYFYTALWAGPLGRAVTLVLSAAAAFMSIWAVYGIGLRLHGIRLGVIAASLFATHNLTKFVTGWASGFQDLLSICLVLCCVLAELRSRSSVALLLAGLAPFAKETGIIALPLLALARFVRTRALPERSYLTSILAVGALVGMGHVLPRLTWNSAGSAIQIETSLVDLGAVLAKMASWFVSWPDRATGMSLLAAVAAAAAFTWAYVFGTRRESGAPSESPSRYAYIYCTLAVVLGLAPVIVGNLLRLSVPKAYYAFPAVPWIALLIALIVIRLPRWIALSMVATVLALNVLALAHAPPNMDTDEAWYASELNWQESVRLSAATHRFQQDLEGLRDSIPHGGVILYSRLPVGSFFMQTGDGAATRELLADSSLRAYYIGEVPASTEPSLVRLLSFDWNTKHFRLQSRTSAANLESAAQRLALGDPKSGALLARYAIVQDENQKTWSDYLASIARLMENSGAFPTNVERSLTFPGPAAARLLAERLGSPPDGGVVDAYANVLAEPTSPGVRRKAATVLFRQRASLAAALEVRAAIALDGGNATDHYILGRFFEAEGIIPVAREEYERSMELGVPEAWAARSAARLNERDRTSAR